MTQIKFWYQVQKPIAKKAFRAQLMSLGDITEKTFYNYLNGGAPKLIIALLSQYSQIETNTIYKSK